MAEVKTVYVKQVVLETRVSMVNQKEYQNMYIEDTNGNDYSGLVKNGLTIPEPNDKIEITYQQLNGCNSIINIKEVNNMTKKTTGKTAEKYFKVKGISYYAHIKEPDTKGKYPTNKYKLDLGVSETTKKVLEGLGVEVKNKGDEKGDYVTLKSGFKPTVLDEEGNEVNDVPLIGNGSQVIVTTSLYDNKAPQGGEKCLGINSVQLVSLVSYEAKFLTEE